MIKIKFSILCILMIFFLSSCSLDRNYSNEIVKESSKSIITNVNEIKTDINLYYMVYENNELSKSEETNWENYMKEEFSLSIDLIAASNSIDLYNKVEEGGLNGIVYIHSPLLLAELKEKNYITNLSKNIDNLKIKKHIPDKLLEEGSDNQHNLWFLPSYVSKILTGRTYNKDFFINNSIKIPENTDEFMTSAKKIEELEMKEKFYIASYSNSNILTEFYDIFVAYGVFPDIQNSVKHISYNQLTNEWEDIVLNLNFHKALEYIKYLKDNNLIIKIEKSIDHIHPYEVKVSDVVVSNYGNTYNRPFENNEVSLYLEGENDEKVVYTRSYFNGFSVLNNTENISNLLSALTMNGNPSESIQLAFLYGVPNYNYIESDSVIKLLRTDSSGKSIPMIGIGYSYIIKDKPTYVEGYEQFLEEREETKSFVKKIEDKFSQIDESKTYVLNLSKMLVIHNKRNLDNEIKNEFDSFIIQVLDNNVSILSAVEEYMTNCKDLGVSDFINKANTEK